MSAADQGTPASPFELPIEPVPGEVVPRHDLARAVELELPPAPFSRLSDTDSVSLSLENAAEGDEAGLGTLRPEEPKPTSPVTQSTPTRTQQRPPRFTDSRHPVRAFFALVTLVAFAGVGLAAAIGVAIALVALALKNAAGS